jgi:hypothetical protein
LARQRQVFRHRNGAIPSIGTVAALVAFFCALVLLGAASGCSASTPQRAVGDFISARIAGNDERAAKLTVEEDITGYMGGEPFLYATDVSYELEPPQVDGDRAVVVVHYSWDDQSADIPYITRRVGTKWRVALRETEELWLPDIEVIDEPSGT